MGRKTTGGGKRRVGAVLVIDDEPDLPEVLAEMLGALGYQVETAPDGAAALDRLEREHRFDLILSDVRMPGLDGPAFYQALEHRHPELVGRVVFMTGNILTEDTADFFAATGAPCLRKPFATEDLQRVFEQVLAPAHA
jgi:CheY-like chemotaxis protein